ncbi:ribosomal biogenesis protein LAS1L-like isoform X1 [Lingula anatina]|uniref:Ribosomal biogenesis protein LAS1L-like isoform X1 n=1 Tax=Lingula anatina TaxID=7574 RepID=A0A1S3H854_LINAN|nr:ribosomal biogenesis protein LAS1L-like isoform X1 [Lingula anatina]|eukprot:XP_013381304.1 ribosomal biogenesis protein LAS1L-like isoform X1 [Lingula anatina]
MAAPRQKRVVGWLNRSEWERVYHGLYSNEVRKQQQAIQRVAVWKNRMLHRLPVAVECTAALVEACLDHKAAVQKGPHLPNHTKFQHNFAMALIRFVNLMTENNQNKQYAQPVHILAEELAIPQWLVELRHESSHTSMPSLNLLKSGAKLALNWLKREYWEPQNLQDSSDSEDDTCDPIIEDKFKDLVYAFQQEQFKLLSEFKQPSKADKKELQSILDDLEKTALGQRNKAISWLCEEGYFISTSEQLDALGICVEDFITADNLDIPHELLKFWKPVLKRLHHLQMTVSLVQHLLGQVTDGSSLRNKLLTGWVFTIIMANSGLQPDGVLYRTPCSLPWKEMLDMCIETPSKWMLMLIHVILEYLKPALTPRQVEQLLYLTLVYQRQQKQPFSSKVSEETGLLAVHNLGDIVGSTKTEEQEPGQLKEENSVWKLCTEPIDWAEIPIGVLPSQDFEYDYLQLPDDVTCEMSKEVNREESTTCDSVITENGLDWTVKEMQKIQEEISFF